MTKTKGLPLLACALIAVVIAAPAALRAQGQQFQFVVAAADANGTPVTDLKPEEVVMSENGMPAKVLKVEPYSVPVKLTIVVDNSAGSREALSHYRTGLTGLVEALPMDVEVGIVAIAPQPRNVVRPTTDREQILRGVTLVAPEDENPRFTDALVEFSKRLERELQDKKAADHLPVLVAISTIANDQWSYEAPEVQRAIGFLQARKAKVMVAMTATRTGDVGQVADINTNRQALIAIPATKATEGKYEALATSIRLATLLPEWGKEIAALHAKQKNQFRVTVERPAGISGELQNPRIELTRPGLTGAVSLDGFPG